MHSDDFAPPDMEEMVDSVRQMIAAAEAASKESFQQGESRPWGAYHAVDGAWPDDVRQPADGIVYDPWEISLRQVVQMCLCLSRATEEAMRQTRQGTVLQSVVLLEQLRESTQRLSPSRTLLCTSARAWKHRDRDPHRRLDAGVAQRVH